MNIAVERSINFMCERYSEPLSLGDIANSAIMSRFHFCRTFGSVTGVTPGRFLSAVRIYQAKRMLVNTDMNVTDVAFAVGYNSLGSFSNHFTDSVGVSPGRYRRASRNGELALAGTPRETTSLDSTVTGTITFPRGYSGARVYVGAFDTPIMQRQPAAAVMVEAARPRSVPFRLTGVRAGTWFLRAVAVADNSDPEPWTRRVMLAGGSRPVRAAGGAAIIAQIELRPSRQTDLPVLIAIPELESRLGSIPISKTVLLCRCFFRNSRSIRSRRTSSRNSLSSARSAAPSGSSGVSGTLPACLALSAQFPTVASLILRSWAISAVERPEFTTKSTASSLLSGLRRIARPGSRNRGDAIARPARQLFKA